jgi:uncharacterized protein (TIGR03083 family)
VADGTQRHPDPYRGPWPLAVRQTRRDLEAYLIAAAPPGVAAQPSLCPAWTVSQVTAHLAETFARFAALLAQSRRGDLSPPFPPAELSAQNLRAVQDFEGDPAAALREQAGRFLGQVADPGELMAHQRGPVPVSLQVLFGLNELAVHHYDVTAPRGPGYRPPDDVITLLTVLHSRLGALPAGGDPWPRVLAATGRERES